MLILRSKAAPRTRAAANQQMYSSAMESQSGSIGEPFRRKTSMSTSKRSERNQSKIQIKRNLSPSLPRSRLPSITSRSLFRFICPIGKPYAAAVDLRVRGPGQKCISAASNRRDYYSLHNRPYAPKSASIRVHLKPGRTILRFNSLRVALRQVRPGTKCTYVHVERF